MSAHFNVPRWSAESIDQEVAKTLFGSFEILLRIHRPEDVIVRNLTIERGH